MFKILSLLIFLLATTVHAADQFLDDKAAASTALLRPNFNEMYDFVLSLNALRNNADIVKAINIANHEKKYLHVAVYLFYKVYSYCRLSIFSFDDLGEELEFNRKAGIYLGYARQHNSDQLKALIAELKMPLDQASFEAYLKKCLSL